MSIRSRLTNLLSTARVFIKKKRWRKLGYRLFLVFSVLFAIYLLLTQKAPVPLPFSVVDDKISLNTSGFLKTGESIDANTLEGKSASYFAPLADLENLFLNASRITPGTFAGKTDFTFPGNLQITGGQLSLTPISTGWEKEGVIYYDTDTHKLYVRNENSWLDLTQQDTDTNSTNPTTATLVVCASNAKSTSRCDYTADGTADQETIEVALNALPSAGGQVILSEGTYTISATIHLVSKSTLKGAGMGATIIKSGNIPTDSLSFGSTPQILGREISYAFVRDLTVQLESSATSNIAGISFDAASHSGVFNVEMLGQRKPALRANPGSDNIWFVNNYVHDTYQSGTGILVDAYSALSGTYTTVNNVFIIGNRVERVTGDDAQGGVGIWSGLGSTEIENIIFANNIITDTQPSAWPGDGIVIYHHTDAGTTRRVIITGNVLTENARYGMRIAPFASALYDLLVEGNIVSGNTTGGMLLSPLTDSTTWIVRNNIGYVDNNTGSATISNGTTSVDVTHGLAKTPTRVILTPTTDTAGKRFWVSAKTSTTFTISLDSTHTSDITFDWQALIGEGDF